MSDRTKVLSVHVLRRTARKRERVLQAEMDYADNPALAYRPLPGEGVPDWAHGVRVEKAGRFQWAVVATEHRGR